VTFEWLNQPVMGEVVVNHSLAKALCHTDVREGSTPSDLPMALWSRQGPGGT
jgi:Zn-dependent alcohol dehydrogenase